VSIVPTPVIAKARNGHASIDDSEALDRLDTLLKDAVRGRMISDVPLGAFLSGGIDSSTVTALMQAQSNRPIRTFTIGFRESDYDEATHAKAVARHLGTDHTELYVEPGHALDTIPRMAEIFDEPFADASQIPTFLVSEMTRKHVTVALSGDGGDELFAGYNRYFQAGNLRPFFDKVPVGARRLIARGILSISPDRWSRVLGAVPRRWRPPQPGDKMHKLAQVLDEDSDGFYRRLVSQWTDPDALVLGGCEPKGILWDRRRSAFLSDFIERMQYLDTVTYLPDDLLTKVDRASMAVSLEARVPLIDHRVVELAWSFPRSLKIRSGGGKWILRELLFRYVPRELISRPKMGFGVPIDHWLRGPLRDWAETLLEERRLRADGVFDARMVRASWEEHQSGSRNWQYPLWTVLIFHTWKERWM
jgi:asparagine synthase (glutamine-hydrolysing)